MNNFYCYILKLNPSFYRIEDWTEKYFIPITGAINVDEEISRKYKYFRYVDDIRIVADSEEEARGYMDNDPAIIGNLMTAEFFDFSIALLRK